MALAGIGQVTVGTSAAALTTAALTIGAGLILISNPGNGGNSYFGPSGVTTATGFPLPVGIAIPVPPSESGDGTNLYLISDTASQKVSYWPIAAGLRQGS